MLFGMCTAHDMVVKCKHIELIFSLFEVGNSITQAVMTIFEPPKPRVTAITNKITYIAGMMIMICDNSCSNTNNGTLLTYGTFERTTFFRSALFHFFGLNAFGCSFIYISTTLPAGWSSQHTMLVILISLKLLNF